MEGAQHGGRHRLAAGFGLDGKILGRQVAADIDCVRRPFRPVDFWHVRQIGLAVGDLFAIGPDLCDLEFLDIREKHNIGISAGCDRADPGGEAHVAGRVDRHALDGDFRRETRLDRKPHVVVGGAELQRIGGGAVVGGERDLRPVGKAAIEQALDDFRQAVRTKLHEQAVGELVPEFFGRPGFVIGGKACGGKGVDRRQIADAGGMALDHGAFFERGADHAPETFMRRVFRVPDRRPVHDLVETRRHQALLKKCLLLVVTEITAAVFVSRWRNRRAGQGEDLQRRTGFAGLQPEFQRLCAVDIGKLVACLAGPGIAARQDEGCFPVRRQMRAFDMLVHFTKAGNGGKVRFVDTGAHFARIGAGLADIGDAAVLDDDFLIFRPCAGRNIQQPSDA
ncbi:hypothetical protein D3C80_287090 [compost metagenome]